jgi:hypothetical protein
LFYSIYRGTQLQASSQFDDLLVYKVTQVKSTLRRFDDTGFLQNAEIFINRKTKSRRTVALPQGFGDDFAGDDETVFRIRDRLEPSLKFNSVT